MTNVVFVAPFFLEATLRFVEVTADLPGVHVGVVSQDPIDRLAPRVRRKLAADWRVRDALDPAHIADGVRGLGHKMGGVDRLLGALEQLQVPLAQVREALGIGGMEIEAARNFRDKSRMKDVLAAAGVPCARHMLAVDAEAVRRFTGTVGYPVVAKPPAGAGARNTFRVETEEQREQVLSWLPPSEVRPMLVEEFMTGEEHSFDSVMVNGEPVWFSVSDYHPSPLTVMHNPWIQWNVLLPRDAGGPRYAEIRRVAAAALRALGLRTGLTHMEWFRREDGTVAISEVGARPPGAQFTSLISYAHDTDFYRAWAELMVFDAFDPPERKYAVGGAYLRGMGRGRVVGVEGVDAAQRELGDLVVEASLPRPGQPAGGSYEGEGYVILRHPDTDVVRRGLQRTVELIRVRLAE
jgi:hypothetical protein